ENPALRVYSVPPGSSRAPPPGPGARHRSNAASGLGIAPGATSCRHLQPSQTGAGQLVPAGEFGTQQGGAGLGEPVWPAALVRGQRFDQTESLEPREGAIQGAWTEANASQHLDVVQHRIAVLGSIGQADQNQQGRFGKASEPAQ